MKTRPTILFLLILLLLGSGLRAEENKEINWQEEIAGLRRELTTRHVDLFFNADSTLFYKGLDEVVKRAPGNSVLEVGMMLQQEVAKLGDANTRVNYNYLIDIHLILPFECYWFEEGLYVTDYWKDYASLEGKRMVSINGFPIQEVIDSLSTLISGATPVRIQYEVTKMITWVQVLNYFGFASEAEVEIGLEDASGLLSKELIRLPSPESERISIGPDPLPLGWQNTNTYFWDQYFPKNKLCFIQYNKCWSREAEEDFGSGASALFMPSFRDFEKEVLKTVKKQEIEKLVIDLRFNDGGNAVQGSEFVSKLQKTKIGKQAEVYLIVGRKTSSEALINAFDVMEALSPVVVGEDTGGRPNHFGEVKRFVLTTSNLIVSYSTSYITLLEENNPPALVPDIQTRQSFEGFMNGKDEAMEAIINHSGRL